VPNIYYDSSSKRNSSEIKTTKDVPCQKSLGHKNGETNGIQMIFKVNSINSFTARYSENDIALKKFCSISKLIKNNSD
jgi:hypothetical protein